MKKTLLALNIALLFLPLIVVVAAPSEDFSMSGQLGVVREESGLGGTAASDKLALQKFISRIIFSTLSLLGVIAIVLVITAGFQWMTAGGNEENVEKAKTLLKNAIIGLAIILLAYSITRFIFGVIIGDRLLR